MNRFVAGLGAGLFASLAVMVGASQVDNNAITSFSNNNLLSADDLNNNNQALIAAINDNAQQLPSGFAAYLLSPNYTDKVLAIKDPGGTVSNCVVKRSYSRTAISNGVQIVRTQVRYDPNDPNATCTTSPVINTYQLTLQEYKQVSIRRQMYDASGNLITETLSLLDPITILRKDFRVGNSLGGASITSTNSAGVSQTVFNIQEILSIVPTMQITKTDNTVLSFDDCFTMKDTHNGSTFFVSWVCKDVGLVRRISNNGDVWELQSYN